MHAQAPPESLWRLGNRNPNNVYRGEQHIGLLLDRGHAQAIVAAMNGQSRADDWPGVCCENRAVQLDRLIEERNAGAEEAARAIAAQLRDAGLTDAAAIADAYGAVGAQCHGDGPGAADDGSGRPPA